MLRILIFVAACALSFANNSVLRIKGGSTASPGEFPYQVSLFINNQHVCGGALITSRHVVTAASCLVRLIQNPNLLTNTQVLAGTNSLHQGGQFYGVHQVAVHPEYQYSTQWVSFVNDIGMILLNTPVRKGQFIQSIDLPGLTELPQDAELIITGWGSTDKSNGPTADLLQKGKLQYITTLECQKYFPKIDIKQYQLCTSANFYVGTCTTDSGSPLVYDNQLVGISTGWHGCAVGVPDLFTKVSYYLKFIMDEVNLII